VAQVVKSACPASSSLSSSTSTAKQKQERMITAPMYIETIWGKKTKLNLPMQAYKSVTVARVY
jgi:hypothetical protein